MVEIWVEFYAGGVRFNAWKHEGRLTQCVLHESINCVCVAASRLDVIGMKIIETGRWREKYISVGTPIEPPYK